MPDLFNFSEEMKNYFALLPNAMQNGIGQGNYHLNNTADLRQCVDNLLRSEYNLKEREELLYEKKQNESSKFD